MTVEGAEYELTLSDRIHDHLLITVPALIAPLWFLASAYALYLGAWFDALNAAFLGVIWVAFWWVLWFGPRMR